MDNLGAGSRPNEALQQSSDLVIANASHSLLFDSLAAELERYADLRAVAAAPARAP